MIDNPLPCGRFPTLTFSSFGCKGEIDLHVGDEVKVLQKNNKMWRGETSRGKIGWFPGNYVHHTSIQ